VALVLPYVLHRWPLYTPLPATVVEESTGIRQIQREDAGSLPYKHTDVTVQVEVW
jgi:hypothetical protein